MNMQNPIYSQPQTFGVWVTYTHYPNLFENDPPVVIYSSEVDALRAAVKDTTRLVKVAYVPFGSTLADKLV
jgi:hypothetical protein